MAGLPKLDTELQEEPYQQLSGKITSPSPRQSCLCSTALAFFGTCVLWQENGIIGPCLITNPWQLPLLSKSLSLAFGSFSWQWATSLFHLTNTAFRNVQDPSPLFRLYHQQDLQSKISIFPRCLISSHFPAWHTEPEAMSPKDPMILGAASTLIIEHTSWIYILIIFTFANLLPCKQKEVCPLQAEHKGYPMAAQLSSCHTWSNTANIKCQGTFCLLVRFQLFSLFWTLKTTRTNCRIRTVCTELPRKS